MRRGVIDIGTNTTHLLIGEVQDGRLVEVLYKRRYYTLLGQDGLVTISEAAIDRLYTALDDFEQVITSYDRPPIHVFATEGLRSASNGAEIQRTITDKYRWPMSIISGQAESQLILLGVQQSFNTALNNHLIMDIGGGSVEFVLLKDGEVAFMKSYPIGISRLFRSFHLTDPITIEATQQVKVHILESISDLLSVLSSLDAAPTLIGCAGTFEIFLPEDIAADMRVRSHRVSVDTLEDLWSNVYQCNLEERLSVPGLPKERAAYIVVALILVKTMIDLLHHEHYYVSKYALKEGGIVDHFYF